MWCQKERRRVFMAFFDFGVIVIKLLEDRILKDGEILPGNVLKVGSFLNQQIDTVLLKEIGEEIARLFKDCGATKVYQLERDGRPIGTGSIISQDDTHAAIAAVAVIPEYRLQGIGTYITKFLIKEIQIIIRR